MASKDTMYGFNQGPIPPIYDMEPPDMSPTKEKSDDPFTENTTKSNNDDWCGFVTSNGNTSSNNDDFGVWQSNSPPPLSPSPDAIAESKGNDYATQLKTSLKSNEITHQAEEESSFGFFYKDDATEQESDTKGQDFENVYFNKDIAVVKDNVIKNGFENDSNSFGDFPTNKKHQSAKDSDFGEFGIFSGTVNNAELSSNCLLYTSPSPRDATLSRMPSSA